MNNKSLALFDFDGTICTKDSLEIFIKKLIGKHNYYLLAISYLPEYLFTYLGKLDRSTLKQKLLHKVFKNYNEEHLLKIGIDVSNEIINRYQKNEAMSKLKWHIKQNHDVWIVSASLDIWLAPWAKLNKVNLICTESFFKDNYFHGFRNENCNGINKVKQIQERINLKAYRNIYAYGDSAGDKEMLNIANMKFFKKFY